MASNQSGGREDWFEVDDQPSYVEGRLVDTGSQGNDKDWPDDLWGGPCTIPQADMLDQAGVPVGQLPDVDDLAGIREACGTRVGWDLAGWRVLTAASTTDQLFAFLRSADEHVATCSIEFGTLPALDVADRTGNGPTSARVGLGTAVLWGQGGEDSDMLSQSAAGRLSHSGAARVVFTTAGGERQSVPVVDGYYTWVSVLETSAEYDQVAQVTVLDAQGNVLHEQQEIVGTPPMTREDPAKG